MFQFDESLNGRKLYEDCNAMASGSVYRFPNALKNKSVKDPQVLGELARRVTIVTPDSHMAEEHTAAIPFVNQGIIQLKGPDGPRTATERDYRLLMTTFKADFPDWLSCQPQCSVVTIHARYVRVEHVEAANLVLDGYVDRAQDGWQGVLRGLLAVNRLRAAQLLPS